MKNENIKTKTSLFIFLLVLVATCFCFGKNSLAEEKTLIINEVLINGTGGEEFVELYNPAGEDLSLKNYYFTYYSSAKDWGNPYRKQKFPDTATIKTHGFYLIGLKGFDNTVADWQPYASDQLSNSNGSIAIFPNDTFNESNAIDFIAWGDVENVGDGQELLIPKLGNSLERINYSADNWQESYVLSGTPGKENSKKSEEEEEEEEDKIDYAGKLKINEILPAPKTQNSGKEFVEIINLSAEKINLSGLRIEDEKNHKVSFPAEKLEPAGLFVLEGNFEFNNTSPDTAFLIAKDGTKENPIDSVGYEKPKYDYAYAFDGSAWQWTSKVTKGVKNEFDKLLSGKIKKDSKIYANVYANFEVDADKKAKKFTWNFGDGHKSYLKKTRHKYEKSGTYDATLKITGDGKENLLSFTVKVEKFGKTKVQIISLSANPAGIDSKNEWLEILNNTKKKVNLKNWSIATGWKKLANHPIKKDFILKAGESKKLTRELCAFALGNKQAKLELRYPDGKVADKLKYDKKDKSISEDELYQKSGSDWQWVLSQKDTEEKQSNAEIKPTETVPEVKIEEPKKADFDLSDLGKSTKNPAWQEKQKTQIVLLFAKSNVNPEKFLTKNQGRVLGISTIKLTSGKHKEDVTLPKFSNQLWKKINAKLNEIIFLF